MGIAIIMKVDNIRKEMLYYFSNKNTVRKISCYVFLGPRERNFIYPIIHFLHFFFGYTLHDCMFKFSGSCH